MDNAFEFVPVSLEEARQAATAPPPGVADEVARPNWVRGPMNPHDMALSELAQTWLDDLPQSVRPSRCAQHYPRIINRLAVVWPDASEVHAFLTDLVLDKRGDRRGFPHGITPELVRLHSYYRAMNPQSSADLWDTPVPL